MRKKVDYKTSSQQELTTPSREDQSRLEVKAKIVPWDQELTYKQQRLTGEDGQPDGISSGTFSPWTTFPWRNLKLPIPTEGLFTSSNRQVNLGGKWLLQHNVFTLGLWSAISMLWSEERRLPLEEGSGEIHWDKHTCFEVVGRGWMGDHDYRLI